MNTSDNKIPNIRAKDPVDILIFEQGLRIRNVIIDKELDLLAVVLNNGKILESKISDYPTLNSATEAQLNNWQLISQGIGISWEELNEDLSVKGFIKTTALNKMLESLKMPSTGKKVTA